MSCGGSGPKPLGGTHRRVVAAVPILLAETRCALDQSILGPGARRNWKGSLGRPATTYQH
jgi:hypothetical protein